MHSQQFLGTEVLFESVTRGVDSNLVETIGAERSETKISLGAVSEQSKAKKKSMLGGSCGALPGNL